MPNEVHRKVLVAEQYNVMSGAASLADGGACWGNDELDFGICDIAIVTAQFICTAAAQDRGVSWWVSKRNAGIVGIWPGSQIGVGGGFGSTTDANNVRHVRSTLQSVESVVTDGNNVGARRYTVFFEIERPGEGFVIALVNSSGVAIDSAEYYVAGYGPEIQDAP